MLPQRPDTLYNSIPKLKSGEIYEVLLRGADGNFSKHTQDNENDNDQDEKKTYLIHVII